MGSSGTNTFSDYPGSSGGRPDHKSGGGGGGEIDKCDLDLDDLILEDVAESEFFAAHQAPPDLQTVVQVRRKLVDGRLAVETEDGEVIGFVPTAYLYLRQCIAKGWEYKGRVSKSSSGRLPKVQVSLVASK